MSKNVADVLGKGLSPQSYIDTMEKNKDKFQAWSDQFAWTSDEEREFFESLQFRDDLRCLIIAAEWCGDCVRNVPVVLRALEATQIPTEILIMEQFTETLDNFLTLGGRSIPVVIFADTGGHVLAQWGPRPVDVQAHMVAFKQANPDREAADYQDNLKVVKQQMLVQYGEGTAYQARIVNELREVLSAL
ncbi:thioredoxin family protein [Paenibacillus sp. 481]|uniref:thioredoxin family protein n=1 Tax=Paenibacillus sp. 481 TaxID=2835869 RepID=UPI001E494F45|nr:thioredoxin family protein [Paenibacillus sp. 481]UHA74747.1 thioredoxin family protein [Paenibacillus sp. 481]